jgi:ferritin-like metal-binding protein YciE
MKTLEEARKRQEDLIKGLADLQRDKAAAAPKLKPSIQQRIDAVSKEIGKLDNVIQRLMMEARFKR